MAFNLVAEPIWVDHSGSLYLCLWALGTSHSKSIRAAYSKRFRRTTFAAADLRNHVKIRIEFKDELVHVVFRATTKFGKDYLSRYYQALKDFFSKG